MIAQKFRPVGWVAGVTVAATALYMISLQVASERGRLEDIDKKISATKRDIRQLQTEMGTRASLRQLERWNGEVLSLSSPQLSQFMPNEESLASAEHDDLGTAHAPPPVMAAVGGVLKPAEEKPSMIAALISPKPVPKLTAQDHAVQKAMTETVAEAKPKPAKLAKPERVAMLDRKLITGSVMSDIAKTAHGESKGRSAIRP